VTRRPDAVVVGAGIVGAACALALARAGLRVLILDSGFAGGGATAAAMGHIVVMDDSEAQFALTAYSVRLWAALAPELPAACEDDACGTLWLAAGEAELTEARRKAAFYRERGVAAELLDARALAAAEPHLRPDLAGALLVPDDRVVYAPRVVRHLIERACAEGAELWEGFAVTRLAAGRVEGHGERIDSPVVVNAAGAAAARLTPGLPIEPRKGHLVITDRHPGFCRHQLVELGYLRSAHTFSRESVAFNLQPRATGQVLVGSSRELVGWREGINGGLLRRMLERAGSYSPGLAGLSALRVWTGFRPATPDNLPLIGAWTAAPGVWIAAGHEGLGITTSLGTAELLADLVLGRQPALDPSPFAPGPQRLASTPTAAAAPAGHGDHGAHAARGAETAADGTAPDAPGGAGAC
jgi:glycine/D-amino acid oxidase-like deaminating enzyme